MIDGDIITYKCGFAVEKSKYLVWAKGEEHFGPIAIYRYKRGIPWWYSEDSDCVVEKVTEVESLENCLQTVKTLIKSILDNTKTNEYSTYLSGKDNFREKIAKTKPYKGNRDPLHKPKYYNEIKDYLINTWGATVVDGIEADDALGIAQTNDISSIICSIDKDLDQIEGWHYNIDKKVKYWVTKEDGIKKFYTQLLTGDVVDNIQGVKGIGPKTAEKLFKDCKSEYDYYKVCCNQYKDNVLLTEMAQLLYIHKKENDEWEPPNDDSRD